MSSTPTVSTGVLDPAAGRGRVPVVRHVPRGHPYVDALLGPSPHGRHPADPPVPGEEAGVWWPHRALDPAWVREHAEGLDAVHVHFGFEHLDGARAGELVETYAACRLPLVLTVHDLEDVHAAGGDYAGVLGVLVRAAAVVTTLTQGAAGEVAHRFGVTPRVIPHPPLLVSARERPGRVASGVFTVGVHLKSLRANVSAPPLLEALQAAVAPLPSARLWVHVHAEVLGPDHRRHDPALPRVLERLVGEGADVRLDGRLPDAQLHAELAATDLAVLPYRWGTHSGWLELCHDLGTPVLAPSVGHYAEQRPVLTYAWEALEVSVAQGVHAAYGRWSGGQVPGAPSAAALERELEAVRAAHRELYAEVLAGVAGP